MYGVYGLYGLGVIPAGDSATRSIQQHLGEKLKAYSQSVLGVLPADGIRGPRTYNALTWLLSAAWTDATTGSSLDAIVVAAASPYMADLPDMYKVGDVQGKLGLTRDNKLGPGTWSKITSKLGANWWRYRFTDVWASIMAGRPLPATDQQNIVAPQIQPSLPGAVVGTPVKPPSGPATTPGTPVLTAPSQVVTGMEPVAHAPVPSVVAPPGYPPAHAPPGLLSRLPSWLLPVGAVAGIGIAALAIFRKRRNPRRRRR